MRPRASQVVQAARRRRAVTLILANPATKLFNQLEKYTGKYVGFTVYFRAFFTYFVFFYLEAFALDTT